jgi:hypothetical protein
MPPIATVIDARRVVIPIVHFTRLIVLKTNIICFILSLALTEWQPTLYTSQCSLPIPWSAQSSNDLCCASQDNLLLDT